MDVGQFQETNGSLEYNFYRVNSNAIIFSVRAVNEARVALTSGDSETNPIYEIIIGGHLNRLVIRKNKSDNVAECDNVGGALRAKEFQRFWITFSNEEICVGIGQFDNVPVLMWNDPDLFTITHFGIRTIGPGLWIFTDAWFASAAFHPIGSWVRASSGNIPPNAVAGGYDGERLYVARVQHEGGIIPGKLHPSHGVTYFPWDGQELASTDYEVLCEVPNAKWKLLRNEDIPPSAIQGGMTRLGEQLYIGRVSHNNTITVGNIKKHFPGCIVSYGGGTVSYDVYEILCSS